MNILIDSGCYSLDNMGDVAMLQVAVSRLRKLWPEAAIRVIVDAPERLAIYCPDAQPVLVRGLHLWFKDRALFGQRVYQLAPDFISQHLSKLERAMRYRWPLLTQSLLQSGAGRRSRQGQEVSTFLQAILEANLVVVSGGGSVTDAFEGYTTKVLDMLAMATQQGKPTVMFSQGLGPIQRASLWSKTQAVLPSVSLLAIREKRVGCQLLDSLGVASNRVIITGDDAIELAYQARSEELGGGIGISLRVSAYSEVGSEQINSVRTALHRAAGKYSMPLISLPISFNDNESDVKSIRSLLTGFDNVIDGEESLDHPLKIIERVRNCRLVVTGSYHPAVFALSQGIPVVGLAKSEYYRDKLLGLADQFGVGCQVLFLDDELLEEKLTEAIDRAWQSAEQVRPYLLEAAKGQIEQGYAAYQRVYDLTACPQG